MRKATDQCDAQNHFFAVNEPSAVPWWWCDLFWCHEVGCGVSWSNVVGCEVTWGEVMWLVATCHVMSRDVMWCDVMWWSRHVMQCDVMWCALMWWAVICRALQWDGMLWACDAIDCSPLCDNAVIQSTRLCTTKYYYVLQSITMSYKVLLCTTKYYSVLLSATKYCTVLLCTTKYYKVLLRTTEY